MAVVTVTRAEELRARLTAARSRGERVGFVPTMGALHDGHLALLGLAASHAELVVMSIFVNPTQFAPGEDFERYPRTLAADLAAIAQAPLPRAGVIVFAPETATLYPPGETTRVHVEPMSAVLCGAHRPGHFEGVATVVTKLFALVGPCSAVFGKKDYQQLQILRRVVTDLLLPVEVLAHPTVRDADGMAKSSRNRYLAPEQRERAVSISKALGNVHAAFTAGERRVAVLTAMLREPLTALDSLDYARLSDADTLQPLRDGSCAGERALVAVAGYLGATRLIDNVVLGEDPAPGGLS